MFVLLLLLSYIAGLLLIKIKYLILTITFLLIVIYLLIKRFKTKKLILVATVFFAFGILRSINCFKEKTSNNLIGIVLKRKDNYFIFKTLKEKFYCYSENNQIDQFDILKIDGTFQDLDFTSYESSFNFEEFLNNNDIYRKLNIKKSEILVKSPIRFNKIKRNFLNAIQDNNAKIFMSSLLFGEIEINSNLYYISKKLMIINLVSGCGTFINFILYGVSKLLAYKFSDRTSRVISLIVFTPIFILNLHRFLFIRTVSMFLLGIFLIDNKNDEYKLSIKLLLFLIFILINKTLIYSQSFYIPLLIVISFYLFKNYLGYEKNIKKRIRSKTLFYVILLPFIISTNNGFNLVYILLNILLLPYFKFLFLISILYFYGLHLSLYEKIFRVTINCFTNINISLFDVYIPPFNQIYLVLFFALLIVTIYFFEINFTYYKNKLIIINLLCIVIYILPIKNQFTCEINFINVGQGDSTLIRYKTESILIDTGGNLNYDIASNVLIPFLRKKRIYNLDYVFITHYDFDHYGSLKQLSHNFKIKKIIDNSNVFPIKTRYFTFENLNPFSKSNYSENDKSLVLSFCIKDYKFLLMGDASSMVENEIIDNNIKCDYLKVGHHGSNSSSSYNFLEKCNPKEAIISCGKNNKFNHPHYETLEKLNALDIKIRRTDIEGTITYYFSIF